MLMAPNGVDTRFVKGNNGTGPASPRVLVVDDDEQVRRLIRRILESARYEVSAVADAETARGELEGGRFDLMVCDMRMPGESGLALIGSIRNLAPHLGVLIVSAVDDPTVAGIATNSGACGYLLKPFTQNELLINVSNALSRSRLERETRDYEDRLREDVAARTAELRQSRRQTVRYLARAVELRDDDTGGHIERIGESCAVIADGLGLDSAIVELLREAAPMHDVGKIGIEDRILRKPGTLTVEERMKMQRHAELGRELLKGSGEELLDLAAEIAWTHHERFDGSGYPRGLRGEEIPLAGRIVAVADVFDALVSDRVYRPAFPVDRAIEMVENARGNHFDPAVVDVFRVELSRILELRRRASFGDPGR
jgi:putative two-component system response regulator